MNAPTRIVWPNASAPVVEEVPLHATPFERRAFVVSPELHAKLIGKRVTERRLDLQLAVQAHEYAEHKREWAAKFGSWCAIDGAHSRERDFCRRMDAELPRLVDEAERQLRAMVPLHSFADTVPGAGHPLKGV